MKTELSHFHVGDEEIDSGEIQRIIEPLWFAVNIYDSEEQYNSDLARFSLPQRYVFAAEWYIAEVDNGGHDQFFFNSTGIVWKDALECFKMVGLTECVDILTEAVNRMGGSPSLDREERWEEMDSNEPDFEDLDSRFYEFTDEAVYAAILEYVRNNRESFYFDGDIEVDIYDENESIDPSAFI